jgi:RND family efflux transporter MFP subunit
MQAICRESFLQPSRRRMLGISWKLLLLCGAVVLAGCGRANEYVPPPPPKVFVDHPIYRSVADELTFTGNTRAIDAVSVRARVNGYLKSIEFVDGAHVEKGQLLFLIEPEPFETALNSAKASLDKALASEAFAKAELERTKPLVARGALSQQELDSKQADLAVARADVNSARAAVEQAELNLSYTRVLAPISGRVGRHLVDEGNLVQMQATLLTTVEAFQPIHAYFSVSEQDLLQLRESGHVNVSTTGNGVLPEVFLALSNEQGFPHAGKLDFADLGVDPATGTQLRRAVFPNRDEAILPGMFVRLRLPVGSPQQRLLIDERAIAADQQGEYVLVVGKDNIVERRSVELGRRIDGMRVVYKGLKQTEAIVVNGLQRARPGAPVDPQPTKSPTAGQTAGSQPAVEMAAAGEAE